MQRRRPQRPAPLPRLRLRHLGARRIELVTVSVAAGQRIRDLFESVWPAVWGAEVEPLESASWRAAMTVALNRIGTTGGLGLVRCWGWSWVAARAGAFEWIRLTLDDLAYARAELAVVENWMRAALDDLGLTALVTSIPGLSTVGVATILAETGDPASFSSVGAANNAPRRAISSSCCADSPTEMRAAGTLPASLTSASTSSVRTGVSSGQDNPVRSSGPPSPPPPLVFGGDSRTSTSDHAPSRAAACRKLAFRGLPVSIRTSRLGIRHISECWRHPWTRALSVV